MFVKIIYLILFIIIFYSIFSSLYYINNTPICKIDRYNTLYIKNKFVSKYNTKLLDIFLFKYIKNDTTTNNYEYILFLNDSTYNKLFK